jgi:FkbM family methyltransferase
MNLPKTTRILEEVYLINHRAPPSSALTFSQSDLDVRRYVLGRNELSENIRKVIDIDGVVDDYAAGKDWHGLPIIAISELPADALVVNCSLSISPWTVHFKLNEAMIKGHFFYASLTAVDSERFPAPHFVADFQSEFEEHRDFYEKLFDELEDDESRQILSAVIKLRLTGNPSFSRIFRLRMQEQYFEDFLELEKGEVFVDVGGFDGDTTEALLNRWPNFREVHFFEPSISNMKHAQRRLVEHHCLSYYQIGLSDKKGILGFCSSNGPSSAFSDSGDELIEVDTLDDCLNQEVSFIKIDIEGLEMQALNGARRHIACEKTSLAIAGYHKPDDLRLIFQFVKRLRPSCSVFLRHYTEGMSETILFFK